MVYPDDLAMKIDQPDFVHHIQWFLHAQEHLDLVCQLAKHLPISLSSTRKSQHIHLQLLCSFPQVTFLELGVCIVSIPVQLIHGEKAYLIIIASLWRLTSILQEYLVLTLLVSSYSFLSHITMSSTLVHLCIGFHTCLNQWIAALACGL